MQEIQKRVRPNTTIIKFDSCVMELATNRNRNGGYWPKCDSPLSNPNIHIGNFWDMQLDNHAMIYFCRQWSTDECLVIHWFCSSHYCSCIITNYVLTCEMKLVGSILIFFSFFLINSKVWLLLLSLMEPHILFCMMVYLDVSLVLFHRV